MENEQIAKNLWCKLFKRESYYFLYSKDAPKQLVQINKTLEAKDLALKDKLDAGKEAAIAIDQAIRSYDYTSGVSQEFAVNSLREALLSCRKAGIL